MGWTEVFDIDVGGRSEKGSTHDEGGYRITTTMKSDYIPPPSNTPGITIGIPYAAGDKIEWDEETLDEHVEALRHVEFSDEEIETILGAFPKSK